MATVNINYDTNTKKCSATLNGMSVSNIQEIIICKSYEGDDKYYLDMILVEEDTQEKLTLQTVIRADQKNAKLIDKYIPIDRNKTAKSIAKMIGK